MPAIIYVFSLCAFAIGFAEFISIGLASVLAFDLEITVAQAGLAVTFYAIGVVIGATVITALTSSWSRKKLLFRAMLIFTLANIVAALSAHLIPLLVARLLSGLAHGVFFAVASSVATQLVSKEKVGAALSLVFGGVTIAMAFGVPVGSWLGNLMPWSWVFLAIAVCGFLGCIGISRLMKSESNTINSATDSWRQLSSLFDLRLLAGASLPLLSYTGSFTLYTFITPLLIEITNAEILYVSLILLTYGVGATLGNIFGGFLTDKLGVDHTAIIVLLGIMFVLIFSIVGQYHLLIMTALVTLLGFFTYGAIPPLQSRILELARRHRPQALDVASGLNIAAFNAGVVMGSIFGATILSYWGLASLTIGGAFVAFLAVIVLIWQYFLPTMRSSSVSK